MVIMNFKKVKNQLIQGIEKSVITEGFLFNKKDDGFEKNIQGGIVTFYFLHTKWTDEINFQLWWAVRIDRIVDIFNMVAEKDKEYFHLSCVLSNNLGPLIDYIDNGNEFSRADPKKYTILKEEDVETVINEALADIRKYILPYFEQNISIEKIDQILNRYPRELIVHNFLYPNKSMMGLIAAKLTKNPNYDQLISIYDEELAEAAEDAKREYEKLKELLSKM